MKYLIATDMDGTLLRDNNTLSSETISYIKELKSNGHKIVLASGRPLRAVLPFYNLLDLDTPIICNNGSYIISNDSYFSSSITLFKKEMILDVYNHFKDICIFNLMCEDKDTIYLLKDESIITSFFIKDGMNVVIGDYNEILKNDALAFVVHFTSGFNKDILDNYLKDNYPHLRLRHWTGDWSNMSEAYYDYNSKGNALKKVIEYYNLPKENVIAFGDASNDEPLLNEAGIGVEMTNSIYDLSKVSKMKSLSSNNDDGVRITLQSIIKD